MPSFTLKAIEKLKVEEAQIRRAAAESLAAENASRLAAMQGAESSIEDRLDELKGQYHRERQTGITEEMQDIVAGFEALRD